MNVLSRRRPVRLVEQLNRDPNAYLAGKIPDYDWRFRIIPDLRNHSWEDGPLSQPGFNYVGPFTVRCSHGCSPGPNAHNNVTGCCSDPEQVLADVVTKCLDAVDNSDIVFCYIERLDCHGTIVELTRAHAQGIPVVIAFAPGVADAENNELWFPSKLATRLYFGISRCQLPYLVKKSIKELAW